MDRRKFLAAAAAAPLMIHETLTAPAKGATSPAPVNMRFPFMLVDKPNKNGRVYPRVVAEKAMTDFAGKSVIGQFGMPESSVIRFVDMSHEVVDLRIETLNGDMWLTGTVKPMKTPMGNNLHKMLEDNPQSVAFRTAGVGQVITHEDGTMTIDPDSYKLISVNVIAAESAA